MTPGQPMMDASRLPLIYFVRHGQTDWNAASRFQGQNEVDLNETGRAQARANGAKLAELLENPSDFDFVSSPMRRTCETMELARRAMNLPAEGYAKDPRLIEVDFGAWTGFTPDELKQQNDDFRRHRRADKWNIVPPGGESYAMLLTRFRPWLEELQRPTVCVTHGGIVRSVYRLIAPISDDDAGNMAVPQDKVLRLWAGELEWF